MSDLTLLEKWNQRHADQSLHPQAAELLLQNTHLLPPRGLALDFACGLGGNALLLAEAGLEVDAWDFSPVAIERLTTLASAQGLTNLQTQVRDLTIAPPPPDSFDVIVVSHFLDRSLITALIDALKTGGLIFYQTFTRISVSEQGPSNTSYRLGDNELLDLFQPLAIRVYREENLLGDVRKGSRNVAMLVAEK